MKNALHGEETLGKPLGHSINYFNEILTFG